MKKENKDKAEMHSSNTDGIIQMLSFLGVTKSIDKNVVDGVICKEAKMF